MPATDRVAALGAGRMGRGIAQTFAFAGLEVVLLDLKQRCAADRERLSRTALSEIETDLRFLAEIGVGSASAVPAAIGRISCVGPEDGVAAIASCSVIFEGVPEVSDAKRDAFAWAAKHAARDAIIASTTSTMSADELAAMVEGPERFLNAHWLNPAHLMPLVEVARGAKTSDAAVDTMVALLKRAGKVPVVMSNSPGYVVPRIQALAMNEAARLYEEGVASAEDIDKAIRIGFGIRYAVLGMLEFIDFGGNDILYHASNYLADTVDKERYTPPRVVSENMHAGRNGLRDGAGFYDWKNIDGAKYRRERLTAFVRLLEFMDLLPKPR